QLVYNNVKVLLAGDATTETEEYILKSLVPFQSHLIAPTLSLESNILKVGHHGSARTSSAPAWIAAVNPEFVFISADRSGSLDEDEKTGHRLPQEVTLDVIRANAPRLYRNCTQHFYISSYDHGDYAGIMDDPHVSQP